MKAKVAIVPRWESPEKKRLRFEVSRLEFQLRRGVSDRRERERIEAKIEEARRQLR